MIITKGLGGRLLITQGYGPVSIIEAIIFYPVEIIKASRIYRTIIAPSVARIMKAPLIDRVRKS
jgi:hypothetical protein